MIPSFLGSCTDGSCDYFAGGYITQEYGSRDGGLSDAMQMETRFQTWAKKVVKEVSTHINGHFVVGIQFKPNFVPTPLS